MRLKQINEELFLISDMQSLTSAYEEISVMKMQQIRNQVIFTRAFIEGVTDVFRDVKTSYRHQLEDLMKNKKNKIQPLSLSTVANNGKDIVVLLSANAKLYGDIITRTFDAFYNDIKLNKTADILIVGVLGKEIYEQKENKRAYTYFQIPDIASTLDEIKPLIAHIAKYQTVRVYFGKFENVVTQNPQMSIVSGQQPLEEEAKQQTQKDYKFFFEPSLKNVLHFFETQLFSSIFKQTLSEHELARYASRIKAMEEATSNIRTRKTILQGQQKRGKNSIQNAKQLSVLSGISLWQQNH